MPLRYLLSTPRRIYVFDLARERLTPLFSRMPEFYGITWDARSFFLSHSCDNNERPWQPSDFQTIDRFGLVARHDARAALTASPREILHGHQIERSGNAIYIANSGRNAISVWTPASSASSPQPEKELAHHYLTTSRWDGLKEGTVSLHMNSVHVQRDSLYAAAHNGAYLSAIWQFALPSLQLEAVFATRTRWAHNVWHSGSLAGLITCNSRSGTLYSVDHDYDFWSCGSAVTLTRGLAATPDRLVVGLSEFTPRSERNSSAGGLAIIDRASLRTLALYWFRGIGNVHEVRAIDEPDDCHAAGQPGADVLDILDEWTSGELGEELSPSPSGSVRATPDQVRRTPPAPRVLEFNGGSGMQVAMPQPGVAIVLTERIGDSNLVIARLGPDQIEAGLLLKVKAWCSVTDADPTAAGLLRLCFLDQQGGYLAEHEARSASAGVGESSRHGIELMCTLPADPRIAAAEVMWLQSGCARVELRGVEVGCLRLPGSTERFEWMLTSF